MREVSREEFQKRMTVMFNNEGISVDVDCATTNFDDMQKAGFVVFDRKELSLSASSKERSLRNRLDEIEQVYTVQRCMDCGIINPDGEHSASHTFATEITISPQIWKRLRQVFDEHFAEDKRFLGDLQKALEQWWNKYNHLLGNASGDSECRRELYRIVKLLSGFEWRLKE